MHQHVLCQAKPDGLEQRRGESTILCIDHICRSLANLWRAVFFNCSLDVAKLTVHEDYASLKVNSKYSKSNCDCCCYYNCICIQYRQVQRQRHRQRYYYYCIIYTDIGIQFCETQISPTFTFACHYILFQQKN